MELRYVRINQSARGVLRPANGAFESLTSSGMVRRRGRV